MLKLFAMAALAAAFPAVAHAQATSADTFEAAAGQARSAEVLETQILLDRARHSPGVIDGQMGANTTRAIRAFQRASGLPQSGAIDRALLDRLRESHGQPLLADYTITEDDVAGPFRDVPADMEGMAKLDRVAFEQPSEALAEKFHMAEAYLRALNPSVDFARAGAQIKVVRPGNDEIGGEVTRVEVDKQANELRAYAADGRLLATYPTTVGSEVHPSPNEKLEVLAIAPDPTYHFDPAGRTWGPDRELTIAAGPNNPVGDVWIDLSRDGFGIHGTPEPRLIGKTSSHGCVRLTNWDARELASAVAKGTTVVFL